MVLLLFQSLITNVMSVGPMMYDVKWGLVWDGDNLIQKTKRKF